MIKVKLLPKWTSQSKSKVNRILVKVKIKRLLRIKLHPVGSVDVSIRQSPPFWVIKKEPFIVKCAESPLATFESVEDVHVGADSSVRLVVFERLFELSSVVGVSK